MAANIVLGHTVEIRIGNLDIVSENLIIADTQVLDACSLTLSRFDILYVIGSVFDYRAELVDLFVIALFDYSAFTDDGGGFGVY